MIDSTEIINTETIETIEMELKKKKLHPRPEDETVSPLKKKKISSKKGSEEKENIPDNEQKEMKEGSGEKSELSQPQTQAHVKESALKSKSKSKTKSASRPRIKLRSKSKSGVKVNKSKSKEEEVKLSEFSLLKTAYNPLQEAGGDNKADKIEELEPVDKFALMEEINELKDENIENELEAYEKFKKEEEGKISLIKETADKTLQTEN